jgi:hypothetical protein
MAQTRHSNGASIGYLGGSYHRRKKHEKRKKKEKEEGNDMKAGTVGTTRSEIHSTPVLSCNLRSTKDIVIQFVHQLLPPKRL